MKKRYYILTTWLLLLFSMVWGDASGFDSDEDGYSDDQELDFGSDPENPASVIYEGGWPYNFKKDKLRMRDRGFGDCVNAPYGNGCKCTSDEDCFSDSSCQKIYGKNKKCIPKGAFRGETFSKMPRIISVDQFGQQFDLFDLVNQGKPIVVEVGPMWNKSVQRMAAWKASVSDDVKKESWWIENFENIKYILDQKETYWVHFIDENMERKPVTAEDLSAWYQQYPNENIILLADPEGKVKKWIGTITYPNVMMLDETFDVRVIDQRGVKKGFESLMFFNYMQTMKKKKDDDDE